MGLVHYFGMGWQEASKQSRWEVGQVYYQRGHWIVTVHILLEKQMR